MADLKISQFTDGGAVQTGDEIATNRGGINTKVFVGSAAALDAGFGVADLVQIVNIGGGNPGLPAIDGSLLTNITLPAITASSVAYVIGSGSIITSSDVQGAIDDLDTEIQKKIENITGLIITESGSNITITGSGTAADPYVIDTGGVSGLGTAAYQNVGTAIGNVVQLGNVGGNAALPAVDGSQLTNIPQRSKFFEEDFNIPAAADIEITGIPANATEIEVVLYNAINSNSNNNADGDVIMQIGDIGGYETSGYISSAWTADRSDAFILFSGEHYVSLSSAPFVFNVTLMRVDKSSNKWFFKGAGCRGGLDLLLGGSGSKALSGELTAIRIRMANSNAWSGGTYNYAIKVGNG